MTVDPAKRKLAAKRLNEHAKLLATFFNSLAIATVGAAFIVPIAQGQSDVLKDGHWILLLVGLALFGRACRPSVDAQRGLTR